MIDPERLFVSLNDAGVDYVLVGGLAANAHGSQRVTKDIDISYDSHAANLQKLCRAINAFNPRILELGKPEDGISTLTPALLKRNPLLQLSTDIGEVDLLSAIAGFHNYVSVKSASETLTIGSQAIRMLTRDGVLKAKRALGRPKDVDDIRQIEAIAEIEAVDHAGQALLSADDSA